MDLRRPRPPLTKNIYKNNSVFDKKKAKNRLNKPVQEGNWQAGLQIASDKDEFFIAVVKKYYYY